MFAGSVAWVLVAGLACFPARIEFCDLVVYRDADGDGRGTAGDTGYACEPDEGWSWYGDDCDDDDPDVSPAEYESCNGVDDNCDGEVDEYCR